MPVRVKVTSNLVDKWTPETIKKVDVVAMSMAVDIHRQAVMNAPVKEGALKSSGRFKRKGVANYDVSFGGTSGGFNVPYARIQELGGTIKPRNADYLHFKIGDHWVKTKSVTIKGTHYLQRAGDNVANNKQKYFEELKR